MKTSIYSYSKDSFMKYFEGKYTANGISIKPFRATQLFEAIYRQRITDFNEMTTFKKEFRDLLSQDFYFNSLEIVTTQTSVDETKKFLFRLNDGNLIETVLMKHNYGYSVCITSQAGCNMGCLFCASGEIRKKRDLSIDEMVLQVLIIDNLLKLENKKVSHVVIMGIGEPLDNYDNVLEFIRIINDAKGLEIGSRHITISTCGLVPRIYDFSEFPLQVNLAISLHFASDEKRSKYMPINKKYNLKLLFEALNHYYQKTNRRITFEYILLDGINDSEEDARMLISLIRGMNCYVNLIPYNNTSKFSRSSEATSRKFNDILMKSKINVTLRKEQGHDIDAACGQLRLNNLKD